MSADAPNVPWVRLNAATFQDARLIRAGFWGGMVWMAALTMAKLHGWRGGRIPKDEFDAPLVAHHLNAVTDETVTRNIDAATLKLVSVGLLEDAGTHWQVRGWSKYQSDTTAAERQARKRERDADVPESRGSHDVTTTGRDVTGRDIPPFPPSGEGGEASPDEPRVRPRPREIRKAQEQERLEAARDPERLAAVARKLPPGVAMHGGYVPSGTPADAVSPAEQARRIREQLGRQAPPPTVTPQEVVEQPPLVVDRVAEARRHQELLAQCAAMGATP